jgi:hypothetical protein
MKIFVYSHAYGESHSSHPETRSPHKFFLSLCAPSQYVSRIHSKAGNLVFQEEQPGNISIDLRFGM